MPSRLCRTYLTRSRTIDVLTPCWVGARPDGHVSICERLTKTAFPRSRNARWGQDHDRPVGCTDNLHRMAIYAGKKAEIKTLKLGKWGKDCLLLFDLVYFAYAEFARIMQLGGHFIARFHGNADPEIIKVKRSHRGRAIDLVGKRIRSCLESLKREVLDVMVKVEVTRKGCRGAKLKGPVIMGLVGIMNKGTNEYHLYLIDLPFEMFDSEQIADLYRGRWCVELLFKELKSRYALDVIHTTKPAIVKSFIYTAMITLVISPRIFVVYRDAMARV